MFDIGFWELGVVAVIGLVVLGPERLPVVARNLGRMAGRARHYMSALTSELEKEIGAEDIRNDVRRAREQIESETSEFRSSAERAAEQIESETNELRSSTERAVEPLMQPIEGETPSSETLSGVDENAEEQSAANNGAVDNDDASEETEPTLEAADPQHADGSQDENEVKHP